MKKIDSFFIVFYIISILVFFGLGIFCWLFLGQMYLALFALLMAFSCCNALQIRYILLKQRSDIK